MFHVYKTLTSDVTNAYAGNVASKFEVKLGLKLPGTAWKVSIVSAMLPRMALFKDLQNETKNLIEMWYDVDGISDSSKRKHAWFHANDLKFLERTYKGQTGIDFMNEVKVLKDERRNIRITAGKKVLDAHWVKLEWKREAGEPELLMHHSNPGTHNRILRKFAETMDWVDTGNFNEYVGMNLVISYPSHIRETSEFSTNDAHKVDAMWMQLSSKADF